MMKANENVESYKLFDLVVCSEFIEHVKDKREFIFKCLSLVKPSGYFFLSQIAKATEVAELPTGSEEWENMITYKRS